MTHPLKSAAKLLTVSATLSIYLLSTSANAALNLGNFENSSAATPAYSGQQFAAFVKSDRDRSAGHQENGERGDDDGRRGGDDDNDGKGHSEGQDNDDGRDGDDGDSDGDHGGNDGDSDSDGDDGGNDGDGDGDD